MLSRVAENIYWLSRYVERAENTARLVRVNSNLMLDTPRGITPGWEPLVDITGLLNEFRSVDREPIGRIGPVSSVTAASIRLPMARRDLP